jgi:superfamily II DNA or RNA helicase
VPSTFGRLSLVKTPRNGITADECLEAFQDLLKSVDLVIVDEGHHEPAYSWAQAVRAKPTIIFSATPYRNDYKYFEIDGNFVFNLPWQEAVREKLIREVVFAHPSGLFCSKGLEADVRRRVYEFFPHSISPGCLKNSGRENLSIAAEWLKEWQRHIRPPMERWTV